MVCECETTFPWLLNKPGGFVEMILLDLPQHQPISMCHFTKLTDVMCMQLGEEFKQAC